MGLSHSPKVISDGLVLYLDATNTRSYSGTGSSWYDLSVYGYNSTLISSPTFINNKYGQLAFNGSTQYATVPYTSTLWNGQTFTLSVWAKKIGNGDQGSRGIMISKNINYIEHAFNGKTMASFRNNSGGQYLIYGNNPASLNEWRHYAITYDGTMGILYENGAATGSTTLSMTVNSTSDPLHIGRWDGGTHYFNGCIAGAMVYNRALNADEILQNYNATKYKYILKENIVTNGLALNYDMSDYRSAPFTGTNIFNISGGIGLSSELLNGPTYSSDFGGNILLDGSNDYIQLSSSYTEIFTAGTTVDVWIKFNSSNSWGRILDTSDGAGTNTAYLTIARWGTNNEVVLESRSSTTQGTGNGVRTTTTAISNGTIQNFTFVIGPGSTDTVSPESPRIYLNANLQATTLYGTQNNFVPYVVNKYVWIGRSAFSADAYLGANIYAYRIYNRALSAQEVLQNYNATKTRFGIS